MSTFDGAPSRGPETLLGVVRGTPEPMPELPPPLHFEPRPQVAIEDREILARTAAEILRDSGATFSAGEIIILAAWMGGMN